MANFEYFLDKDENKCAPEFKEFKAEEYKKPSEFFQKAPEAAPQRYESFSEKDGNLSSGQKKGDKEKGEKEKTRTKLKRVLDSISKTVAKATTTVVGVAAVGVGAVIALSPLFTPSEPIKEPEPISVSLVDFDVGGNYMLYELDVSGLQKSSDYDILISGGQDKLVYDDVTNGTNREFVLGLSASQSYTLSVIEKTEGGNFVHYEKEFSTNGTEIISDTFQATLETPSMSDITVEWHEDKNTVILPALFSPHADTNYKYRVSLTDKQGGVVSSYEGHEGATTLDIPLDVDEISVVYEAIYDTGYHEIVYSTEIKEENLILKAPEISFDDEKKLLYAGYYDLTYTVSSTIPNLESYESLTVTVNGVEYEAYFTQSDINNKMIFTVEFTDPVDEFDVEATLILSGAYGGNKRTVTYTKHYVNELEFYDEAYYSKYNNAVEFRFLHSEIGGYVIIKNELTLTEERIDTEYHSYPFSDAARYTYALYNKSGERLTEEKTVNFESIELPSYTFDYTNPGEVISTINEDSTLNFYFDTNFSSVDPSVYYEITMSGAGDDYVFTSREQFLAVEGLPNAQYALKFRVLYEYEGSLYELYSVVPSGTTYFPSYLSIGYTLLDDKTVQFEFYSSIVIDGEIKITLDGDEYSFTQSELEYDGYNYTLTLSTSKDAIQGFELTAITYYTGINDYIFEQYKDQIKGTQFATETITY